MNGAERRRVNQVLRQAVALEILRGGAWQARSLDEELLGTDRVCQRWAISVGSGMKVDQWDETPVSRLSPLDDLSAILTDQIICKAPIRVSRLVIPWYKGTGSVTTMMRKLGVDREGLHQEWRGALWHLKTMFHATGHQDLIDLLDAGIS